MNVPMQGFDHFDAPGAGTPDYRLGVRASHPDRRVSLRRT